MGEIDEKISEAVETGSDGGRLNSVIAILVALVATFMAIDNVKDGNIGQAMAQAQARTIDTWSLYQAKSTKQNLAESTLDQLLAMQEISTVRASDAAIAARIATYKSQAARYEKEKGEIKAKAEAFLNENGLQFSKHGDVIGAYGKEFSKTKLLDQKFHRWLIEGFDTRLIGDYHVDTKIEMDTNANMINQAREFYEAALRYLEK